MISILYTIGFCFLLYLLHSSACSALDADYTGFAYEVAYPCTGDYKSQVEACVGSNVQEQCSLLDADGKKRTVSYASDVLNSFKAVMRKEPDIVVAAVVVVTLAAITPSLIAACTIFHFCCKESQFSRFTLLEQNAVDATARISCANRG